MEKQACHAVTVVALNGMRRCFIPNATLKWPYFLLGDCFLDICTFLPP